MTSHQVFHGVAPSFEQDALVLNTETKTATVVGKISGISKSRSTAIDWIIV